MDGPAAEPAGGRGIDRGLTGSDAVQLFMERARAVRSTFTLDAGNAAAVADVCRRLDGLSLAIEMAAARLPVLSPQEIARNLGDRFALLELSAAGRLTRHRTLEAAIDASHALLSEHERAVFERLSVFVGPFDLEAAGAVGCADEASPSRTLAAVTALVDASLLSPERDGSETRYRLLETLREYGLARLRRDGVEDEVRQVHAAYRLDLAARAGAVLGTPGVTPWMARLAAVYAELRQALGWSLAHEPRAVALRAAPALRELWFGRGDQREAARWTAQMLAGHVDAVPPGLLAEVRSAMTHAAVLASDLPAALSLSDEAVRLARTGESTRPCSPASGRGPPSPSRSATLPRCDETRSRRWQSATGTTTAGDAPGRWPTSGSRRGSAAERWPRPARCSRTPSRCIAS